MKAKLTILTMLALAFGIWTVGAPSASTGDESTIRTPSSSGIIPVPLELERSRPVDIGTDAPTHPPWEGSATGQRAPDFALSDLGGDTIRLSDLRGRIVVLNVWASYCPYCRHEMPALESIHQAHRNDLTVLGVNVGEDEASVRRFVDEVEVAYPILIDRTGQVASTYHVKNLPATFLIDEHGVIAFRTIKAVSEVQLNQQIEILMRSDAT